MLESLHRLSCLPTFVVLGCSAVLLTFTSGCGNRSSTATASLPVTTTPVTPAIVTDVYVAGEDYVSGMPVATLWKNGVESQIGATGRVSLAAGIANAGSDVYVAGVQSDGAYVKPTVWKNGVASTLQTPFGSGFVSGIALSGADVYVCGDASDAMGTSLAPLLWKNGLSTALPMSEARAVAVSGVDVYVTGYMSYPVTAPNVGRTAAIVVKNGVAANLDPANAYYRSSGSSVFVQGNDVYVGGSIQATTSSASVATIWKNGVATQLSTDNGYIPSVFVNGIDVYAAGFHGLPTTNGTPSGAATVWKNGTASDYSIDTAQSIVLRVTVNAGNLYAVGFTDKGAYLWKDGLATVLPSTSTKASANAIAIYQH